MLFHAGKQKRILNHLEKFQTLDSRKPRHVTIYGKKFMFLCPLTSL